ncbi:hypothetical protein J2S16_003164 [Cytobacillus kochii]|nr:hypothetical protein [Cytobacillus kochii]
MNRDNLRKKEKQTFGEQTLVAFTKHLVAIATFFYRRNKNRGSHDGKSKR